MKSGLRLFWSGVALGLVACCVGCSGLNHTHSVSPASFFIPGFGQVPKTQPTTPPTTEAESPAQVAALVQ